MESEEEEKENIIRAKQAISPDGLEDQSAEAAGASGVGSEVDPPKLNDDPIEDEYMNGDEPAENVRMMNPNRNPNPKPDIDKPSYS